MDKTIDWLMDETSRRFAIWCQNEGIYGRPWRFLFDAEAVLAARKARAVSLNMHDVDWDKLMSESGLDNFLLKSVHCLSYIAVLGDNNCDAPMVADLPMQDVMVHGVVLETVIADLRLLLAAFPHVVSIDDRSDTEENGDTLTMTWARRLLLSNGHVEERNESSNDYVFCPVSTAAWKNVMGNALDKVWRENIATDSDNSLSFDSEVVVLRLTNGRIMTLGSSEWGYMGN